ncbi:hypothetical protein BGW36DRAFT_387485 [Talaromyces proteolyticus]|uniref:Uncharacterized protein n=1 Tax=Talaromyces proteolyticus TaxID=1131652 RepID=A0AAD4KP77_9EURO|nr:uncharacterized protein BGW36DRAFT_387485 [Talaromyces proteolyticus]KAH8692375.1 hypothetical protein BGW36DRAFT_387485 [Talaromyces proteolyticus]
MNQAPPPGSGYVQPRIFPVYNASRSNLTITMEDDRPIFFVENSSVRIHKPDVALHAGTDKHAPIVALCKFSRMSGDSKIGLGDPNRPNGVIWEELTRKSWNNSEYQWIFNFGGRERRQLTWKRTHSVGVGNDTPSFGSSRNFKLVDSHTNDILAVYNNAGMFHFNKCGKFQINVNYGREFDTMVFLTGLALLEKARRRSRNSSGAAAGAASAGS